jgi:hypothetical protein
MPKKIGASLLGFIFILNLSFSWAQDWQADVATMKGVCYAEAGTLRDTAPASAPPPPNGGFAKEGGVVAVMKQIGLVLKCRKLHGKKKGTKEPTDFSTVDLSNPGVQKAIARATEAAEQVETEWNMLTDEERVRLCTNANTHFWLDFYNYNATNHTYTMITPIGKGTEWIAELHTLHLATAKTNPGYIADTGGAFNTFPSYNFDPEIDGVRFKYYVWDVFSKRWVDVKSNSVKVKY